MTPGISLVKTPAGARAGGEGRPDPILRVQLQAVPATTLISITSAIPELGSDGMASKGTDIEPVGAPARLRLCHIRFPLQKHRVTIRARTGFAVGWPVREAS